MTMGFAYARLKKKMYFDPVLIRAVVFVSI